MIAPPVMNSCASPGQQAEQAWAYLEVKGEQRDRDGDDGVGEGEHPGGPRPARPTRPAVARVVVAEAPGRRTRCRRSRRPAGPPSRDLPGHARPLPLGWVKGSSRNTRMNASYMASGATSTLLMTPSCRRPSGVLRTMLR